MTFASVQFGGVAEHDDGLHLLLDHQIPEVFECVRHWSLSADEAAFSVGGIDPVGMDVLPGVEQDTVVVDADDVSVAIELWVSGKKKLGKVNGYLNV